MDMNDIESQQNGGGDGSSQDISGWIARAITFVKLFVANVAKTLKMGRNRTAGAMDRVKTIRNRTAAAMDRVKTTRIRSAVAMARVKTTRVRSQARSQMPRSLSPMLPRPGK